MTGFASKQGEISEVATCRDKGSAHACLYVQGDTYTDLPAIDIALKEDQRRAKLQEQEEPTKERDRPFLGHWLLAKRLLQAKANEGIHVPVLERVDHHQRLPLEETSSYISRKITMTE